MAGAGGVSPAARDLRQRDVERLRQQRLVHPGDRREFLGRDRLAARQRLRVDVAVPATDGYIDRSMTNWQPSEPEWLRVLRELRQRVAEAVTPWLDVGAQVSERLRLLAEQLPSREEFESFIERFNAVRSAVVSPNCEDLETGEMVDALELMRDEGLNLAWAPHANLIRELVAAEDAAARERLPVDRTDDVLRDLTASLEQVTQPLLSDEVVTAHEAIASYRAGRHRATQALAGVLVGALIEGRLGMTFAKAHGLFETLDHEEAVCQEIRVTAVARSVAHALTTYRSGDPAPPRFNRHATLHGTAPGHYTVANALTGLLLACNTIRELDFWLGRVGENGSNAS